MAKARLRPLKSKPLHACLFVILALAFVELALRGAFTSPELLNRLRNLDYPALRKMAFIQEFKGRPEEFYSRSKITRFDPLLGWALRPNLKKEHAFSDGRDHWVSTNSDGLRSTREPAAKKGGKLRIAFLGDSFTYGDSVNDEETYASVVERALPDVESLNFGVPGYAHDQMLLAFQAKATRYNPDIVVLGFVWSDMLRNLSHFRDYAKPKFELDEHQRLRLTNSPVPDAESVLKSDFFSLKIFEALEILFLEARGEERTIREAKAVSAAILKEMAEAIRREGARPVFVYLPVYGDLQTLNDKKPGGALEAVFFRPYCKELRIDCFSIRPAFAEAVEKGARLSPPNQHWSKFEHALAGKALAKYLKTLLPK